MKKIIIKAKKNLTNQKEKYIFLGSIILLGIISGILFIFFISNEDKLLVHEQLTLFINNINSNKLNYLNSLTNSLLSNSMYLFIIWILGISIIGIPIIIFILFFKGFIFGFSISSIISNYGFRGVLGSIAYQIPHNAIMLVIWLLLGFYAIRFSIKLIRLLFLKEKIDLNIYFKNYIKVSLISLLVITICSLIEVFIVPFLINLVL